MTVLLKLHATPAHLVAHANWSAARIALLGDAANGPGTVALLGDAGTGKTWLLRALRRELEACGCRVTLLQQGDFGFQLEPGSAVLIDEASRLDEPALAMLLAQRTALVILADLPSFAARLERHGASTPIVRLDRLDPMAMTEFAKDWLRNEGDRAIPVTSAGLARLAAHAEGTPRLAVQMLNATAALAAAAGMTVIDGPDMDEAASLRLGGIAPEPSQTPSHPVAGPRPRGWVRTLRRRTAAIAVSAVAAGCVLYWALAGQDQGPTIPRVSSLPHAETAHAALAERTAPGFAASEVPRSAVLGAAPVLASTLAPVGAEPSAAALAVADRIGPSPIQTVTPAIVSIAQLLPRDDGDARADRGGPGLVLVARPGDSLKALYANIYQGVRPPPYQQVAAANPMPIRAGNIVVFPAPPEGWKPL